MSTFQPTLQARKSKYFNWSFKRCLLFGVLILVPFTITMLVILWLFGQIRNLIRPLVAQLLSVVLSLPGLEEVPPTILKVLVFILTILILMIILYLIGLIGSRVLGKRMISLVEGLIKRIPLAGSLYGASKQVVDTFSGTDKPSYKSVVLVKACLCR